jgi:hypothetical protein
MPEPPRLLLKIRSVPQAKRPRQAFALGAASYDLEHLFDLPATPAGGLAAAPSTPAGWYVGRPRVEDGGSPWDAAHAAVPRGTAFAGADELLAIEPDMEQSWLPDLPGQRFELAPGAQVCAFEDQRPALPEGNGFAWHLGENYSGLKPARDTVMERGSDVIIAHIDTGYDAAHKTLPENLDKDRQRNFVDADRPNDATDQTPTGGILRNRGHGTGTLSILAGRKLEGIVPPGDTRDYLGGAPKAKIVPVRVADSVVHFWTSAVARAFEYARTIGADVISMSMGGLPSAAWADAVNAAYDAGVVMVCAAGNNFGGLPTRNIVYPARFRRVIAACGIMANMRPYYDQPMTVMQGNYGPSSKMDTAVSAFTPNIAWARLGCANLVDMDGAGTSSATPQVAAAAALWLRKHKDNSLSAMPGWARVEAVRAALFNSAGRDIPGMKPADVREMLGKGFLRASEALKMAPAPLSDLKMTPADSASFAFLRLLTGLGIAGEGSRAAMFRLEMAQLAARSRALEQAILDPDADPDLIPERDRRRFVEALLDEKKCSRPLQSYLEQRIGRRTSSIRPAARAAVAPGKRLAGSEMQRTIRRSEPSHRRLQIYAIDPSFSSRLDTAFINHATIAVPWERSRSVGTLLQPGPVGECVEVVDVDPASGCAYAPVDLNDPLLLAQDGLSPSEGDPQFHQQMVYAVAMTTIRNFEIALGRAALWSPRLVRTKDGKGKKKIVDVYVPRLRLYPHALREANAYYSPEKKALLFGYFPAGAAASGTTVPGSIIFTCLSHDIIAHETTHALLDGLHRRFQEATNPDVLAFHEAFADIVAIFQHFTFPTLLRHELRRTRGQLAVGDLMADLARQFGEGIGRSAALRSAIGKKATGSDYRDTTEPHDRGAILVSAVFAAFLAIYGRRTADLVRLASNGSGVLPRGDLHPDLVERLADEAARTAGQVLTICIRALDYLPPVDVSFGDYLRALITADADLVPNDSYGYRFAFLEAFRSRGICAENIRTLSVDSLRWQEPAEQPKGLSDIIRQLDLDWDLSADRAAAYRAMRANGKLVHDWIAANISPDMALQMGLNPSLPKFEVHSVRPARRTAADGSLKLDLVVVITQKEDVPLDSGNPAGETFTFRGGTTLIIDARKGREHIRYSVMKSINSQRRLEQQRQYLRDSTALSLSALYFPDDAKNEPFAMLHNGH